MEESAKNVGVSGGSSMGSSINSAVVGKSHSSGWSHSLYLAGVLM